ncbi:MAG: FAD-binding oxidoreductase [Planctomycetaceae bacterium]|nr:FAD-binding oxidoreductase [Planctomycetaceae bacterium]
MSRPSSTPTGEFVPTTAAELARYVDENSRGDRRPLNPLGGRTALQFGNPLPPDATAVDLNGLSRVIDYPARDMTITVEAGVRVAELQGILQSEKQRIAVDVSQSHRATLGGAIATNSSGPARFGNGTFRDYVIGISAVDGRGRLFSAGGRVVKNVAGYDLCKLLVGSYGTLAIITQVTLKLRPLPETRRLLWVSFRDLLGIDAAVEALLQSQTRPCAVEVLNAKAARQVRSEIKHDLPVEQPVLCLAFEGSDVETRWQIARADVELTAHAPFERLFLGDELAETAWTALVEYQAASDDPLSFQATIPPSRLAEFLTVANENGVALQAHAGNGVVLGHFPDSCTTPEDAAARLAPLRAHAERHGGALVVWSCDPTWRERLDLFGRVRDSQAIARGIRNALDPHQILNPGLLGRE